jgi:Domain of unknown function (DUF4280)
MPLPLCTGAVLQCTQGVAPSVFVATPRPGAPMILGAMPVATIDQILPVNILPFGVCRSMANPTVAAATAAAQGVLTPMPCVPMIAMPWTPPAVSARYASVPMATVASRCACAHGGMISVSAPFVGTAEST